MRMINISLLILFSFDVFSQQTYSNDFMTAGISARAASMGNAAVAGTFDVTAAYWNPAGLVFLPGKYELGLMHSEFFGGLSRFDYFAGAVRSGDSTAMGFTVIRSGVDDIQNTLDLFDANGNIDFDRIKKFSVADYAFLVTYSKLTRIKGFSVGANVKIIRRTIGDFASAWGFGFDLAALYRKGPWNIGAMLKDAATTFNTWSFNADALKITVLDSTYNTISNNATELTMPSLILGVSRIFTLSPKFNLNTEINAGITFDGARHTIIASDLVCADPVAGVELDYKHFLFVRIGLNNLQYVKDTGDKLDLSMQPDFGLGIRLKKMTLDYAISRNSAMAEYTNVFSLKFSAF